MTKNTKPTIEDIGLMADNLTITATVKVSANEVEKAKGNQYTCKWVLDFTGSTQVDVAKWAKRGLIIAAQREARAFLEDGGDPDLLKDKTFRVMEYDPEKAARRSKDPVATANRAFNALSDDEKQALIKELQEKMAA